MIEQTIYIPVYNFNVILLYGNPDKIAKYFIDKHSGLDVSQYVSDHGNHFTVLDHERNKKFDYIILYEEPDMTTVFHESQHVAWEVLNDRNVAVNYDNQEPLAYLTDYIAESVLSFIVEDIV